MSAILSNLLGFKGSLEDHLSPCSPRVSEGDLGCCHQELRNLSQRLPGVCRLREHYSGPIHAHTDASRLTPIEASAFNGRIPKDLPVTSELLGTLLGRTL